MPVRRGDLCMTLGAAPVTLTMRGAHEMTSANRLWCLAGLLAAPVLAAPACASDFCITASGPIGAVYVGRALALPKAGQCVLWKGFCASGCSPDNVQDGVACASSDGTHVSFGLTTYYLASNRQFDWVRLDLPGLSGGGNLNYLLSSGTTSYTAAGASCSGDQAP